MGDKVLVEFGKLLTRNVRPVDLVSRIGGEEFCVILVDSAKQGAERVSEKIRMNMKKIRVEGWTDTHGTITVSIGCAPNYGNHTLAETLKFADEALFQAKRSGRNQVCFAGNRG